MTSRRSFIGSIATLLAAPAWAAQGRQKTILLRSGWATINIGDIGHTPGTLRLLEQYLPDVQVIAWVAALDQRVRAMLRRRFPKAEIVQGQVGDAVVDHAFKRADLVIHNSNMGHGMSLPEHCIKLGKAYGLYGQSYFPDFVAGEQGRANLAMLNQAAFVYCRDGRTLETLRQAGAKPGVLEFGPDGCFGIDVRDDERALAFMRRHGLKDREFITLQLRTQTAKYPGKDGAPRNPLHPTPQQQAEDERRAAKYREVVATWVRKTGGRALIAPEVKKEMEHNRRLIYDPLPDDVKAKVVNCEEFWNVDEAASVLARAHTCICHEPHSLIIALANGTPTLHTYSESQGTKCWMFEDIGLPESLLEFDSTSAAQMTAALFAIHNDYPRALARVGAAMDFVRRRQAATMQAVRRILDRT
jgi:hypothetical protein